MSALRRDKPSAWWLVRILCPPAGARRFAELYLYFRWADDIIDAPGRDPAQIAAFVARQEALMAREVPPEGAPEEALCKLLQAPEAAAIIDGMWAALRFDAERGPEPLSDEDLAEQIARIGDSYSGALWWCAGEQGPLPPEARWLARAATAAHMMRDVPVDLELGYCNVPASAVQRLGGLPLDGATLARWRAERGVEIDPWFARGLEALPALGRGPWLLRAFAWKYRRLARALAGG